MDGKKMTRVVLSCGICGACPAVEISTEAVMIGEDDNTVRLTHAQWNDLVSRIRTGELGEFKIASQMPES
jgi:hypothetical protein